VVKLSDTAKGFVIPPKRRAAFHVECVVDVSRTGTIRVGVAAPLSSRQPRCRWQPALRFLDPDTLSEIGGIHVSCEYLDIRNINEIE
jgi:hypothetical protein